jgi:signal transduction histidine kinase/FixJ family two-component response regulator
MYQFDAESSVLSASAPSRRQRRFALGVAVASIATVAIVAPSARVPLGEVTPFIPIYQTATLLADFVTAVLLAADLVHSRRLRMVPVLAAYCFNAFIIVVHTLSFPGAFAPAGVIGGGPQTTAWLYYFWHGGFVLFLMAYALVPDRLRISARPGICVAVGAALALVLACTWIAVAWHDRLPVVIRGGDYSLAIVKGISPALLALGVLAIGLLWRHRYRSVLDLWLLVVLCAWSCDVVLGAVIGSHRFDMGFYAGRTFALLTGSLLLVSLIAEVVRLQFQVARSQEIVARTHRLEALGQLAAGVAHDFNNVLLVISGAFKRIETAPHDFARVQEWARGGSQAVAQGAKLAQQLLALGRGQEPQQEMVELKVALDLVKPLLQHALGAVVRLELRHAAAADLVRIDRAGFEAAILNLVINARDAMPDGGTVTIETSNVLQRRREGELAPGEYVQVRVADRGVGMDRDVLEQAMMPFFTTKRRGLGTGLGLSQVHGFARQAGGDVRIESVKGAGTAVSLYLPKLHQAEASIPLLEPSMESSVPLRAARQGETVLVVDDEPTVLDAAAGTLEGIGYRVLKAGSAREALTVLQGDEAIDFLFSDVVMPGGMNGVELAVRARQIRPGIKVLLTSGQAHDGPAAHQYPADLPLLAKPYQVEQLSEKITAARSGQMKSGQTKSGQTKSGAHEMKRDAR